METLLYTCVREHRHCVFIHCVFAVFFKLKQCINIFSESLQMLVIVTVVMATTCRHKQVTTGYQHND